jgi:hypothetical protein
MTEPTLNSKGVPIQPYHQIMQVTLSHKWSGVSIAFPF